MVSINKILNSYLQFIKTAIEVEDWILDDIKEELQQLPEIEKDPVLVNFREPFSTEKTIYYLTKEEAAFIEDYNNNLSVMQAALRVADDLFHEKMPEEMMQRSGKSLHSNIKNILPDIANVVINLTDKRYFGDILKNRIVLSNGSEIKATQFYERCRKIADKAKALLSTTWRTQIIDNHAKYTTAERATIEDWIDNHLLKARYKNLENLNSFNGWNLRLQADRDGNKSFEIVFSTKPKDIYGMSSRSEWTSCQNIEKGKPKAWDSLPKGVVGSCAAKNIGIIYLTDNTDWEGRGERMLYRSVVWLLKHIKTGEIIAVIMKVYPQHNAKVANKFKELLEKHLKIKVVFGEEDNTFLDFDDYFREVHEEEAMVTRPYADFFVKSRLTFAAKMKRLRQFINNVIRINVSDKGLSSDFKQNKDIITNAIVQAILFALDKINEDGLFEKAVTTTEKMTGINISSAPDMFDLVHKIIQHEEKYKNIYLKRINDKLENKLEPAILEKFNNYFRNNLLDKYIAFPVY